MAQMKLVYFNARGVIECARVMLRIGGVAFEDCRLSMTPKEGGGWEAPEFAAMKASGECIANMNRVPILVVDGVVIGQSKTIERFVAKKCNMLGSNEIETAQIDCIVENIRDIKDKYKKVKELPPAEKEEGLKKWFATDFTEWLIKLEKSFPTNATAGFSVGSAVSHADVVIWCLLSDYFDNSVTSCYKGCDRLEAIVASVSSIGALKIHLAERPVTGF